MKSIAGFLLLLLLLSCICESAGEELAAVGNDSGQNNVTSKVYSLENVKASDIMPFVEGAVLRSSRSSSVSAAAISGRETLIVTMPVYLVPSVDEMIKKLDSVKGSQIAGTGITDSVYKPKYVPASSLALSARMIAEEDGGRVYVDRQRNIIAVKGSASMNDLTVQLLNSSDKMIQQASLVFRLTTVSSKGTAIIRNANLNRNPSYFEMSGDCSFLSSVPEQEKSQTSFEISVQSGKIDCKTASGADSVEVSRLTFGEDVSGNVNLVSGNIFISSFFRAVPGEERFIAVFKKGASGTAGSFSDIISGRMEESVFLSVSCKRSDVKESLK